MMNQDNFVDGLSQYVYHTIALIHQRYPHWVVAKYRNYAWDTPEFATKLTPKLKAKFLNIPNPDDLVFQVIKVFRLFLSPHFFTSQHFIQILDTVRQNIDQNISQSLPTLNSNPPRHQLDCAILLLDVENLYLDADTEQFLSTLCHYPLQIKIAFANWRSQGKKDLEFHQRGYELIHVPPGKDSADVKMATVGSSIFIHYPTAREVLVCSSDTVLTHLCNTLQTHGLTVYLVKRDASRITVTNHNNQQANIHIIASYIPSLDKLFQQVKQIIQAKKTQTSSYWIKFSEICQTYKNKHEVSIREVVTSHFPDKKPKDIFIEAKDDFVTHQSPEDANLYLATFNPETTPPPPNSPEKLSQSFTSKEQLEVAILQITSELLAKEDASSVAYTIPATVFSRKYQVPITKVMKQLGIKVNYLKFLQSCSGLVVKNKNKRHSVFLADSQTDSLAKEELENILVELTQELCEKFQTDAIQISYLASNYREAYQKPVTQAIKELGLGKRYLNFLQSSARLEVKKRNKQYYVTAIG